MEPSPSKEESKVERGKGKKRTGKVIEGEGKKKKTIENEKRRMQDVSRKR